MAHPSNLRAAALSGVKWNFIGQTGRQFIAFFVSITLARLLTPREFGLLAMLFIFQEVANALVNSGLNAPLIQSKEISGEDCSTVFYFNVAVAVLCYFALVFSAPYIATFYREPDLDALVSYYGLVFLIHAFGNVQLGLLMRGLDYRQVNLISLVGVASSGLVAVLMALRGYGVYSLLGQHLTFALVTNVLYWLKSTWRPTMVFSGASFRRFFAFGSRVLVVSLLDKLLGTLDDAVIGRLRGTSFLGQYSRGKTTRDLPLNHVNGILTSLVFPLFSRIREPGDRRDAHARFLGIVSYLTAPLMVGMGLLAEPLIAVLYGDNWRPAAVFLRLFCVFGITVPLNSVMVQTVMSSGEHGRFFRLEMAKKTLLVTSLGLGALLGPVGLVWALCVGHYLGLLLSARVVARFLETTVLDLIGSAVPGVAFSLAMAVPVYLTSQHLWPNDVWRLLVPTAVGAICYWVLSALFGSRDYLFVKRLILEKLGSA